MLMNAHLQMVDVSISAPTQSGLTAAAVTQATNWQMNWIVKISMSVQLVLTTALAWLNVQMALGSSHVSAHLVMSLMLLLGVA